MQDEEAKLVKGLTAKQRAVYYGDVAKEDAETPGYGPVDGYPVTYSKLKSGFYKKL